MKRITSFIRLLVCLIFMAATTQHALAAIDITATQPANGTGTTADPYQIGTPGELYWFAKQVNNGQNTISAKLTADIVVNENVLKPGTLTLNGTPANEWTPIGTNILPDTKPFKGTFDGNGHTISGLYFNNTTSKSYPDGGKYIGLIGYANGAVIKNVVVKDSYLYGSRYVASICGYATGSTQITNCGYEGYAKDYDGYACGIAYNSYATVENCYIVSNLRLASSATTNCYHDNSKYTGSTANSTGKPSEAFANGEVAFLLGDAWGQTIGTDAMPKLGGDKVYKNTYSGECSGEDYSNVDEHGVVTERNHNFNEEGACTQCGLYFISTADQLYAFAAKVNAGQKTISAKLTADIVVNENVLNPGTFDLNGTPANEWTPIGISGNTFQGTFDGNGHTISGLYFNNTSTFIGLIGWAYGATIKNVVVKDSYLYGRDYYVAGICGYATGSTQITNCGYVGYSSGYGIAYNDNAEATVKNCYSVSNKPLSNKATTNCYHDNSKYTSSTTYSTGKPSTAFASGEVAWLLGDAWGQKIGTDATLRLGGDKVYKNTYSGECSGEGYSNVDEHGVVTNRNHNFNEEGVCIQCDFYIISTADQLYAFAAKVNAGLTTISAKLTADIVVNENVLNPGTLTLNGTPANEWTPIGTNSNNFKGTFDGNGHTISGLYFNNTIDKYYPAGGRHIGLIGVANGAVIKNVVVKDSYLNGYYYVAGICGYANGSTKITNCGYEGYVSGGNYTSGIAYNYSATVENCYSVSNLPLSNKATTNCYHDKNKYAWSTTASTGKPSTAFASGEVAWLLGDAWGQKIGTDATLRLGGDKVYATALCPHTNSYSNTPSDYIPITDGPEHYDSDGCCKVCGAGQPATLVNGYYEIDDAGKLYWFANQVNNGQNTISAKLTADIVVNENVLKAGTFDLNGASSKEWTPIGTSINNFKGTFDGNGHTISGLYFNNTADISYPDGGKYIGLIGYANGATIKNVVVKDSYLNGYFYVAGICGYAYGSTQITNCGYEGYVKCSIDYNYAYGIAYNENAKATVKNCYSVSNQPLSNKATTNCYHDNSKYTSSTTYSTGKPSEAFASGEVAFLLGEGWGQKIGTDATPRPGSDKVYKNTYSGECPGEGYSNVDENGVVTERNHNFNAEGVCIQCGLHLISTADQLYAFAAKVNAGQTTISAKLTADIVVNENVLKAGTFDLNGTPSRSWTPIGTSSNNFKGTFDGNGHTISGLFNNTNRNGIGLIGYAIGATIKNVVVKDSYIRGYSYVAGICGSAGGSTQITNCGYEGYVYGDSYAYGIAYNESATIKNCYSVSSQPLSNKATTNCYHDNSKYTGSTTYSTGKPSTAFASGEVAFLLGEGWGQKIGTDVLPIPGSDKVYKNTYSGECSGEGYSNVDEHGVVTERNHNCNEEGVCIQCGFHLISTADQLYAFAAKVNAGGTTLCAKLTADIVVNENVLQTGTFALNGTPANEWTPIGTSRYNFIGTFDGNGHTISGLYFNNTSNTNPYPAGGRHIGLIGVANGAVIKNVVVKDSYLNGYYYVAGICGYANGSTKITNCGYEGYSSDYGIVDNFEATVENCYSVSNKPLADKETTNCYHDNNKYTGYAEHSTGKPSEAFASGEVAFLLGDAWGQKIGTDATPRLGSDKVYKNTYSGECSGEGYSNVDEHGVVTERNHNFNEEGVCIQCSLHLISTADQLYAFAAKVNAGQTTLCAKLTADIVVNENVLQPGTFTLNGTPSRSWTPIGTYIKRFQGTFDGNGHTISGLYFYSTSTSDYPAGGKYIGLIGEANGATIKNVVVKDSYLNGSDRVAGICGYAGSSTQITNCGYEGYVNASNVSYAYGIAYNSSATVENCYSVSNQPLAYEATTNSYHDNNKYTGSTANSTGKSSTAFASGEVAFLLGDAWGQKIGTDATPKLGGAVIYSITTTIATGGHGTFICPSYANEGETITCSSEPNIGYELVLKVNGNAHTGNTFTMPAENTTLLVDFTKIDYAVTTATGLTGGSIAASATAQYQDEVTVTVTPATGYKLDAISVKDASDNAVSVSNGKFTMPASAVNVSASFSKIDYAVTTATDLTGGSVSADATAQYQDEVTVTATPAVGYKLDAITVKDASNNAVAVTNGKFTMPASAVNVTASFSKIDYAVTTATGLTGGSVSADATAQYQDEVTVTATPATGYKLDAISVKDASDNAVSVSNGKFTMPASAVNVTASFSKIDYAVTTATGLTGGSVSAVATAQYQDEVTITATPAVGYKLDAITVKDASNNAVAVSNGKFTMPASAVNVSASFSPTGYVENGQVYGDWVVTSDYTIAEGETLVIPAGTTVTTYGGAVIINNGTLKVEDEISGVTLAGDGVFNYTTLDKYDVTFGTAVYNGSPITIGNGLDVTYATKSFCGKTFAFDAESCTITYTNNVNASVGTRYAVVTWDFSGNTATKEFAILKRKLNLTGFIANNKNYDSTTQATGSFSDDRIAGDELEFNYKCAFEDENVGTGKNVSFYRIEIDGGADADNYELVTTEGSASADINKAPLTIKANDFTINVGDDMPTFTVEYDGFVSSPYELEMSTLPTVGVDITDSSVAGTYDIIVSGAVADSYEITYINGTLTINPAIITAIDEVASSDVKIYSRGNIIVVENADSPIDVFDISGRRIERLSDVSTQMVIPVSERGVFVVRSGNISKKLIVK